MLLPKGLLEANDAFTALAQFKVSKPLISRILISQIDLKNTKNQLAEFISGRQNYPVPVIGQLTHQAAGMPPHSLRPFFANLRQRSFRSEGFTSFDAGRVALLFDSVRDLLAVRSNPIQRK